MSPHSAHAPSNRSRKKYGASQDEVLVETKDGGAVRMVRLGTLKDHLGAAVRKMSEERSDIRSRLSQSQALRKDLILEAAPLEAHLRQQLEWRVADAVGDVAKLETMVAKGEDAFREHGETIARLKGQISWWRDLWPGRAARRERAIHDALRNRDTAHSYTKSAKRELARAHVVLDKADSDLAKFSSQTANVVASVLLHNRDKAAELDRAIPELTRKAREIEKTLKRLQNTYRLVGDATRVRGASQAFVPLPKPAAKNGADDDAQSTFMAMSSPLDPSSPMYWALFDGANGELNRTVETCAEAAASGRMDSYMRDVCADHDLAVPAAGLASALSEATAQSHSVTNHGWNSSWNASDNTPAATPDTSYTAPAVTSVPDPAPSFGGGGTDF